MEKVEMEELAGADIKPLMEETAALMEEVAAEEAMVEAAETAALTEVAAELHPPERGGPEEHMAEMVVLLIPQPELMRRRLFPL